MKSKNKKAIGIMLAVLIAVSVFIAVIPGIASEPSNTPATTEQTEERGIKELQQRVYEQGYNYAVAENWITRLSSEERNALCGYKPLKSPTEPLSENVRFVLDVPKVKTEKIVSLPSSYDAMALGHVTPVKNQICGACWLHGAIADFESDVAIGESNLLDFSEQEVGDCNIWASVGGHNYCDGGNALMTANYFTKYGLANESCHPYNAAPGTCQNCPVLKNVDNWRIITGDDGESQIYRSTIKNAILAYGPVYSTIYASDSGFSAYSSGVYEYEGAEETNHAIEIIGWDDSLGAWLIKNSWGTDWGALGPYPGCAWVAYGAANIGDDTSAIAGYKNPGDLIFYHDECGWMTECVGCGTQTAYGAVRFIPSQNATLTAADFWAVGTNMAYEIEIFDTLNMVGNEYTFSNQLGTTQTGSIDEMGYYSIPLNTPIPITSGDDFIVQVNFTSSTHNSPIPIDYCDDPDLNWSGIATSSGESYMSCDGTQFTKYSEDGIDIGIRARAEVEVEVTQPFDTGSGTYPSIFGTHTGTITPNQTINVSKMFTYSCSGTGGHSEYVAFYNAITGDEIVNGTWTGYQGAGDYHYIIFENSFMLKKDATYNYTVRTGSYPQIHHTSALPTANGWINCTEFTDANGKKYNNWIPAIRLE